MKQVDNISVSKMPKHSNDYPETVKTKLYEAYGLSGIAANFEGERNLTEGEIEEVADLISSVEGRLQVYQQWQFPGDENFWGLCFGYE